VVRLQAVAPTLIGLAATGGDQRAGVAALAAAALPGVAGSPGRDGTLPKPLGSWPQRQRIAALVGVAPGNRDRGTWRGRRTSGGGRAPVRARLYMRTVGAVTPNPILQAFYVPLMRRWHSQDSGPDGLYAPVAHDPARPGETAAPLAATGGVNRLQISKAPLTNKTVAPLYPDAPLALHRHDPRRYSLVEIAIRQGLG
jgi:hypothetical protein